NQQPKTEGCSAEGEPVDLWYYRVEQPSRSVPRETREPQAGPASCLSNSASKVPDASGDGVFMPEPKIEIARAKQERSRNDKERRLTLRESDWPIVFCGRA